MKSYRSGRISAHGNERSGIKNGWQWSLNRYCERKYALYVGVMTHSEVFGTKFGSFCLCLCRWTCTLWTQSMLHVRNWAFYGKVIAQSEKM